MLYVQHWSFKTGYHQKGAEKFLAGGGDYPGVEMIGRYHAPGSLEGWIVLKTEDPKAIYQHAAEWGELLNWKHLLFLLMKKQVHWSPKFIHNCLEWSFVRGFIPLFL